MRNHLRLVALIIPMVLVASNSYAAVKAGSSCSKAGIKSVSAGKTYTCVKSGKKLVWNKGVLIPVRKHAPSASAVPATTPTAKPTPAPIVVSLTFDNLLENTANISYTAWKKSAGIITASTSNAGSFVIYSGPNTPVQFEDVPYAISQVSKLFPNQAEPKENFWIRYNFADIDWAESKAKEKLTPSDYNQIALNQGGSLAGSNCDVKSSNCRGSYQQTGPSGISVVMLGVESAPITESLSKLTNSTGMLEAHEYFHALQRIPIMNRGVRIWPHAWWREGGATWVQNFAINYNNYEEYKRYLRMHCSRSCLPLTEDLIAEFLTKSFENNVPANFDPFLNYSLGSHVVEIFVAMRGPDVLVDMYAEMGKGLTFDEAFKVFFGIAWKDAIPTVAKSIYQDLHS
jgi:hypothetical protein